MNQQNKASDTSDLNVDNPERNGPRSQSHEGNKLTHETPCTSPINHTESVSSNYPEPTSEHPPPHKRRIKWTNEMNAAVMKIYYEVTECGKNQMGYRQQLHRKFIEHYPELHHITEQNIADRRRQIEKKQLLPTSVLQKIKENVNEELQSNTNNHNITLQPICVSTNNNTETIAQTNHTNPTTTTADTNTSFPTLKQHFNTYLIKYQGIAGKYRPIIPRQHNSKKLAELVNIMNKQILPEQIPDIESFQQLTDVIYSAAAAIITCNGSKLIPVKQNKNKSPKTLKTPKWEKRIQTKIEQYRGELSRITEYSKGKVSRRLQNKINKIRYKYNTHTKYDNPNETLQQIRDTITQKLSVQSNRLRRYKKSKARRSQNNKFRTNEKLFYRQLTRNETITTASIPNQQEIEEYWGNLWSDNITHNQNTSFIKTIEQEACNIPQMTDDTITLDIITQKLIKTQNWKTPGEDKIQNFWLKKLKSLHPTILKLTNNAIKNPNLIPTGMCRGITFLKPKTTNALTADKYRPITCLNTLYKLITACINHLIENHCTTNNIIEEEQKGCRIGSLGCKEQLIIDSVATCQATKNNRNLYACFIDYQKAYDSIPHSWLIYVLKLYKIHPTIINFLHTTMTKWRTQIALKHTSGTITTKEIHIRKGIFQGDSLSTLWFCLGLNPLSTLLKTNKIGYKIKSKEAEYLLTHLFYVDDLKLYANTEKQLQNSISIVETFSNNIKMNFGIDKCKIQAIQRGKLISSPTYNTQNEENIPSLEPYETYKYLGFEQSKHINHSKAKNTLTNTFNNRLKQIFKTSLNSKNLIKAVNTYAIPSLTYSFGILHWTKTELEQLERNIRTQMTKHKYHHPKAAVERISLPRSEGGRGVLSIQKLHNKQIQNMRTFFYNQQETSHLTSAVVKADQEYTPLQLGKDRNIQITGKDEVIESWKSKILHGKYANQIDNQDVDKIQSFKWLVNGRLFAETEGFFIAIQDQVLPTKSYRKHIIKENNLENDSCRKCLTSQETITHILTSCQNLAGKDYKERHDKFGKIIHKHIAITYLSEQTKDTKNWEYEPQAILENQHYKLYWDRTVITDHKIQHNRPDTILIDKRQQIVYIIDYAIVDTNNIKTTENKKIHKYEELAIEIKTLWNMKEIYILPLIMSFTGIIHKTFTDNIRKLKLPIHTIDEAQQSVILSVCQTMRKFLQT